MYCEMVTQISFDITHYFTEYHTFLEMRPFKFFSLNNFQVHNTVLLTIVTTLLITRSELIYPVTRSLWEKAMAPHSNTLAWKIPWMEEPGRLQSMGSLGVRHDWANSLSLFTFMHWRRKWQLTPVFWPGESQGWGSLVGCRLWGHTESDTTEAT